MKILFLLVVLCGAIVFCSPVLAEDSGLNTVQKKELNIGLLPYVSASRLIKTFLPLKKYLEDHSSYKVTFLTAPTFKVFVERTLDQHFDIIFTAPHFALLAEQTGHYQRLARFSRELTACVFVRSESQINTLQDLKNSVVSTPDSLAIVSVLGEVMLKNSGLDMRNDVVFLRTPSHNNVIISVTNKSSDAGIVASGVYEVFASKQANKGKTKILNCSESVPTAMFLANGSLPQIDREKIAAALLDFPQSEYGKSFFESTPFRGMQPIIDKDMQVIEKYLHELKARL